MASHYGIQEVFRGDNPVVELRKNRNPSQSRPADVVNSIVAVHGLNGDAIQTWTTNKTEKFWLGDPEMLPKNMSNARILSFGYDASATAFFGRTSSDTILQHAHTLVAELVADRQLEGAVNRPIIFICHSLGGIVVKRALAYSASRTSKLIQHLHSIFVSTYAILFLGTPHQGSNMAKLASTSRKIVDAMVPSKAFDTDGQLLEALQEGSEILQNVTDMFAPLMKNFRIYFFWEQQKTDFGTTRKYVVKEHSAAPILDDTERAGLPYDHRGMCRFESRTAPGYRLVVAALMTYTLNAPSTITQRWVSATEMLKAKRDTEAAELLQ
ncbi:MAG: hypothetical protein LQ345_006932 [Seirophora villosa]|nr:MAG: hypothetical protein LQ345_006932 [Seirophora villosa]